MPDTQETKNEEVGEAAKNIRTYQSDVEELLKEGEGSLAKIAAAESQKKAAGGFIFEEPDKPRPYGVIAAISAGFIILGLGIFGVLYYALRKDKAPVSASPAEGQSIIITDLEKDISLNGLEREAIIARLIKERQENEALLSSVIGLRLTETKEGNAEQTAVTAAKFLEKLKSHAPSELVRSLSDNFALGLHVLNVNQPFLILKTSYYQNAFAGMLAWESNIESDIGEIFIRPEPAVLASTSEQLLSRSATFEDLAIKNRDTRALRNNAGKIIFLYSFPDKNTVIITANPDTLEKISARLLARKLVQ